MAETRYNFFGHDHPLRFSEAVVDDYADDPKPYLCSLCGLPILSSPSYSCTIQNCNFFLHKPCAERMPRKLSKPRLHPLDNDDVRLKPKSLPVSKSRQTSFAYECTDCDFEIHPLFAVPVEIKVKHRSHPQHPLVAACRETLSLCDGCGEEHKGFFFCCKDCNFWIHQDCTLLPGVVKLRSHPYPYILTYHLSDIDHLLPPTCVICEKFMRRKIGLYFCGESLAYAHVSCAMSNLENLETETRLELTQLPDNEWDTSPSLVIRRFLESSQISEDTKNDHKKLTIFENCHKHPYIFHDGISSSSSREACDLVCDVCIQPINISSPLYRCLQPDCHFLVHKICANLPSTAKYTHFEHVASPISDYLDLSKHFFNSVFPCIFCRHPCNGFFYYSLVQSNPYFVDLECASAPRTVKHASHKQHVLFRTLYQDPLNCCSVSHDYNDTYRCVSCNFNIHVGCALLPEKTRHKYDEHPLELIMNDQRDKKSNNEDNERECCFCEFCETDIDRQYWYYGCHECEHYFHVNCIPSVGYLSKVKFGKTVDISPHNHPLSLTRMLTVGSQRCGYCKEIIQGFVDEMAFYCFKCDFWIHFTCARDSAVTDQTSKLKVYTEGRFLRWVIID